MSQQINEVFGSTNEETAGADTTVPSGSISVSTNATGNNSSNNVENGTMKRSREE